MSYKLLNVFGLLCTVAGVLSKSNSIIVPCKNGDVQCMIKSANIAVSHLADGIPSLNINSIDPLILEDSRHEVHNLVFHLKNNVASGYGKCSISDIRLQFKELKLNFTVNCPPLAVDAHLDVSGELYGTILKGNDTLKVRTDNYVFNVEANIDKVKGSDGNTHMAIKIINTNAQALGPVKIEYKNLHTENKLSPDGATNVNAEQRKKLFDVCAPIYINNVFKTMFQIVNKFLEIIPFDDLFID